jgi:hypothetical protein
MNARDLQPSGNLAKKFGVKSIVYGKAGIGKTPIAATAPRPVLLAAEPGLLSMKGTNIPTWECYDVNNPTDIKKPYNRVIEFFDWFFRSNESKSFDTLAIDSLTQVCEIVLRYELGKNSHGLKGYGEMSRFIMETICEPLYYMPNKHLYLICKQEVANENGQAVKVPFFPGQDLKVKIPHLFDEILHLDEYNIPGVGKQVAFRCKPSFDTKARDRSGMLNEFEPPNLGNIFTKCSQ